MCYECFDIGMNLVCVNVCLVGVLLIIDLDVDFVFDNVV